MKKNFLISFFTCCIIFFSMFLYIDRCSLKKQNKTLQVEKQILIDNNEIYSYINSITVDSFEKKIKNNEDIFVYIENNRCSDCSYFSEILKDEIQNFSLQETLYLLDISKMHEDKDSWLAFKEKYDFSQTPAFLLFQQGREISKIQWDEKDGLSKKEFRNWLNQNKTLIKQINW